jgi:hypothetical protein
MKKFEKTTIEAKYKNKTTHNDRILTHTDAKHSDYISEEVEQAPQQNGCSVM